MAELSSSRIAAIAGAFRPGRAEFGELGEDFEAEIRIEQSVHLVGQLPTLVIGNWLGVLVGFLVTVNYKPWWSLTAWLWILALTLPMAANWLKLRNRPRPQRVSSRRIRTAGWHSLAMGLSWAVVVPFLIVDLPTMNQLCLVFGIIVLCTGSVASISALPFSAMAYFVPMMAIAFWMSANHGTLPYQPVAVLSGLMFVALFGFLRQNWNTFRRNVAIAVERTHLADLQKQEVARRAAVEIELRAAKDAAVEAADEVREAQERLHSIIEALPLPVAIFRLSDGHPAYVNKWTESLIGLEASQIMQRRSADFFPDPAGEQQVLGSLRGGRTMSDHETVLRRADGTNIPVRLAAILMDYEGEKAVLSVAEDITLRKQQQEQLEQARSKAEEANIAKSRFLANMSHELRTPLNAVLGYAELMADGIYGKLPEKASSVLERIQSNGRHLLGLINDVLDLSKIEADQLQLAIEPYSWESVVQTVSAATESLAKAKGLELRTQVDSSLPMGQGDTRRLTQVLLNLVGNAIKFTDAGHVGIAARRDGEAFEVTVSDTGPGIAAKDQARIFDEFQQVDDSNTRKKGGTGLGLAISKRIIALHGGTLSVRSQPGEGATFIIRMPMVAPKGQEAA